MSSLCLEGVPGSSPSIFSFRPRASSTLSGPESVFKTLDFCMCDSAWSQSLFHTEERSPQGLPHPEESKAERSGGLWKPQQKRATPKVHSVGREQRAEDAPWTAALHMRKFPGAFRRGSKRE